MLRLCSRCQRHHFTSEPCPFCASHPEPKAQNAFARRAVSLAAGAVVVGTFGCAYGAPEPYCPDAGARDPGCPALDGGISDAGANDAGAEDAGDDADAAP
jgi:hypothetical protein